MREVDINENDAGQRLDKFLTKYLPALPASMLYRSLRKNCVRINGKHVRDGAHKLQPGDRLQLYLKDEFFEDKKLDFLDAQAGFEIIFEDQNILIVNKKAGVCAHPDEHGSKNSLIAQIQKYLYQKGDYDPRQEQSFSPALCNRLDRNTSGLMIAAKNAAALREMNQRIKDRQVRKFYRCIAIGTFVQKEGLLEGYLTRGDKKVTVCAQKKEGAKQIRTAYRVLKETKETSLLEVELLTGRTHQIRAQFAQAGHPLLGDIKYGGKAAPGFQHQALCSYRLVFNFSTEGLLSYLDGRSFCLENGLLPF